MSDNSFIGAIKLVLRPFFSEELDDLWRIVRGVAVAALIVALCLWLFSFLASDQHYARAKIILNYTAWFSFIIFVFSYGALYWEVLIRAKENEEELHRRRTGFTNVEK